MMDSDDDIYFEHFSVFTEESRPAPRVEPLRPAASGQPSHPPKPAAPQKDDNAYFMNFSVFDEGARYAMDAPTLRIPADIITQLRMGVNPPPGEKAAPATAKWRMQGNLFDEVQDRLPPKGRSR